MLQKIRTAKNLLLGRPILAIFDVTRLCNQRCPMCNIWKTKSDDMSLERIVELADELQRFGVGYVFLQGGEPTIRGDIVQIIDVFIERGIKPTLITNGLLLTDAFAAEIAARKCNLSISLDSMKPEIYERIRGTDKLEQVLGNIQSIAKIKKRGGNWAITSTITKLSALDDIKALDDFSREHGFMYAIRPYIFVSGTAGRKEDGLVYTYDDVAEIFEYISAQAKKENYLAFIIYREHIAYLQGKPMLECDAMKRSFLLKENGCFAPCIEYPGVEVTLGGFAAYRKQQKRHQALFRKCNKETPCFYNDAREIGVLLRRIPDILLHFPQIVRQMIKLGNFF